LYSLELALGSAAAVLEKKESHWRNDNHKSGGFASPTSAAWSNVTVHAPVINGSCKKIKCKSCLKEWSGSASRNREHFAICPVCPEAISTWARGASKRAIEMRKFKELAKNLDSKLQGEEDDGLQHRRLTCPSTRRRPSGA
jgi:hypothetical protein